jgi:hypothetical protein
MKVIALALFGALTTSCYGNGSGSQSQTAAVTGYRLQTYDTFSFGWTGNPPEAYEASARSLEVDRRLGEFVGAELRQKGYVEDNSTPSFLVRFGAGVSRIEMNSTAPEGPSEAAPHQTLSREGIKIVIYDILTKTEVWQGSSSSVVDLTRDIDDRLLQHDVHDALASFPVRKITAAYPFRG